MKRVRDLTLAELSEALKRRRAAGEKIDQVRLVGDEVHLHAGTAIAVLGLDALAGFVAPQGDASRTDTIRRVNIPVDRVPAISSGVQQIIDINPSESGVGEELILIAPFPLHGTYTLYVRIAEIVRGAETGSFFKGDARIEPASKYEKRGGSSS